MLKLIAALAVAWACLAGAAEAQTTSAAARQVFARAQAASGGAAWNSVAGLHEAGRIDGVAYERWLDPIRWGDRMETHEPAGRRVHGYNGMADWQILPSGQIVATDARASLAQARTAAYLGVHGFFFPSRFAADTDHLGVREASGRSFDVVRVTPLGGEPRELWFDRRSSLLGRIVDRTGAQPVTTEVSDYRRVGAVLLPHRFVSDRGGRAETRQAERIDLLPPDRNLFSWARPQGQ